MAQSVKFHVGSNGVTEPANDWCSRVTRFGWKDASSFPASLCEHRKRDQHARLQAATQRAPQPDQVTVDVDAMGTCQQVTASLVLLKQRAQNQITGHHP